VINFFFTGSAGSSPVVDSTWLVEYNKLTKDNARGDFEAGASYAVPNAESATEIVIPQINVQMRSEAIVAKTKKLKAQWTPEFAQDLNAYHSLDAEAELTAVMSEYISLEIDLEILDMLIESAAAGTEYWSAVSNEFINSTNGLPSMACQLLLVDTTTLKVSGSKLWELKCRNCLTSSTKEL
jgi:hypothetical protein